MFAELIFCPNCAQVYVGSVFSSDVNIFRCSISGTYTKFPNTLNHLDMPLCTRQAGSLKLLGSSRGLYPKCAATVSRANNNIGVLTERAHNDYQNSPIVLGGRNNQLSAPPESVSRIEMSQHSVTKD